MKKGFTLIELLIVIAILAVLAVTVTLILNPAELIKQGRDSTRLSDLDTVNRAVSLYLADQGGSASFTATSTCTASGTSPLAAGGGCGGLTVTSSTAVTGVGWVNINFSSMSTGAPLGRLPIDPVNDTTYFYVFAASTTEVYEVDANMESTRYANGGGDDVESDDGGSNANWYETGSNLTL